MHAFFPGIWFRLLIFMFTIIKISYKCFFEAWCQIHCVCFGSPCHRDPVRHFISCCSQPVWNDMSLQGLGTIRTTCLEGLDCCAVTDSAGWKHGRNFIPWVESLIETLVSQPIRLNLSVSHWKLFVHIWQWLCSKLLAVS